MSLKKLAEGIILQSIEDLWNENYREDCFAFFKGEDFRLCAELADMGLSDQVELLTMVKRSAGSSKFRGGKKTDRGKIGAQEKRAREEQLEAVLNYS